MRRKTEFLRVCFGGCDVTDTIWIDIVLHGISQLLWAWSEIYNVYTWSIVGVV